VGAGFKSVGVACDLCGRFRSVTISSVCASVEPICALCLGTLDGSVEHIFPSALGGRKTSTKLICGTCNNKTGSSLDAALAKGFVLISNALDITTGRGEAAAALTRIETTAGDTIDLRSGMEPVGQRIEVIESRQTDGALQVQMRVPQGKEGDAVKRLTGLSQKHSGTHEPFQLLEVAEERYHPTVALGFKLGDAEQLRAIAKIGYLMFCHAAKSQGVGQDSFEAIRKYICTGEGAEANLVGLDTRNLFQPEPRTLLIHRVLTSASKQTHCAVASVELFGAFSFRVLLTSSWTGEDVAFGYSVNPRAGKAKDLTGFQPCASTKDEILANQPLSEEEVQQALTEILAIASKPKGDQKIHDVVEQFIADLKARKKPNEVLSSEDCHQLADEVKEKIFKPMVMKTCGTTPMSPEEFRLRADTLRAKKKQQKKKRKRNKR
jgi:HNH endonuclease